MKNFSEKLDRVYNSICQVLSVPNTGNYSKKFLLTKEFETSDLPEDTDNETFEEVITYLKTSTQQPNFQSMIKNRINSLGNKHLSYVKRKITERYSERMELKRKVDPNLFDVLLKQRDTERNQLQKKVTVFVWENRNFLVETHTFETGKTVQIFRYYCHGEDDHVVLPDFVSIGDDISEDDYYNTYNMTSPDFNPEK